MHSGAKAIAFPTGWQAHVDIVRGVEATSYSCGEGLPVILVHGIGPGTLGVANFEPLLDALSTRYQVHLLDLIGFGASGRKAQSPFFDPDLWVAQIEAVKRRIGAPVVIVGNSVGGALAFRAAAELDDIVGVAAIGSPLCNPKVTSELRQFWTSPADADALARAMRPMTAASLPPAPERVAARYAEFAKDPAYAEYFDTMLCDAVGALRSVALTDTQIDRIDCPMLIVHGTLDRACPFDSAPLHFIRRRPDADLMAFGHCGHNVTWERTADLLDALTAFLRRI